MSRIGVDSSVAIPLLMRSHPNHTVAASWAVEQEELCLSGYAQVETYSVLTRLAGDARVAPEEAARLLDAGFGPPFVLHPQTTVELPARLARIGVFGGAVYDALVALAALENDAVLATRDARALATYNALGVQTQVVGGER